MIEATPNGSQRLEDSGLVIRPYSAGDSAAAMRLENRAPQGNAFRLRFERPYFHRRAENFETWQLVTARKGGDILGVAAGALKPVIHRGSPTNALYLFDVRVAPEVRRQRVAQQLVEELVDWAGDRAELGYGIVAGDNEAAHRLTQECIGAAPSQVCAFLVYPTYKSKSASGQTINTSAQAAHKSFLAQRAPFEFYSDPASAFASDGYLGSWVYAAGNASASCSAWSNENIFAEVVEQVPPSLALIGSLLRTWPLSRLGGASVPRLGERLRSWYIFDFQASDDTAAKVLMHDVAAHAKARGIDYCYVIHQPGQSWADGLRRQFPRALAPIIPYSVVARAISGEPLTFNSAYIDIRDV